MVAGIAAPGLAAHEEHFDYPVEFPPTLTLSSRQLAVKYVERLTSCVSAAAFKEAMTRIKPAIVVYHGIQNRLAKAIEHECRAEHVPVVVDETDWFETRFKGDVAAWIVGRSRDHRVCDADEAADGILAISPFFKDHFESIQQRKGAPHVMFLPPLDRKGDTLDEDEIPLYANRKVTRFFYAGSPAGKDLLKCFVDAMAFCSDSLETTPELDVVGVSPSDGEVFLRGLGSAVTVRFHGRLPHSDTISMLRKADFGILFRHPERYARAGFSTKFAECMSNGVPMICNAVGGADLVLSSGVDGLVVPDLEVTSIAEGIRAACDMDDDSLFTMKRAALAKSKSLFQPERYVSELSGSYGPFRGCEADDDFNF